VRLTRNLLISTSSAARTSATGWLMVLMGLLFFVVAAFQNVWTFMAMLVFDVLCIAWSIVYSYLVYRIDPHRTSPAFT
jgi:hypothetical protein